MPTTVFVVFKGREKEGGKAEGKGRDLVPIFQNVVVHLVFTDVNFVLHTYTCINEFAERVRKVSNALK